MGSTIQPGARIDEDLYEQFKSWVRSHHGDRRGAVGAELERALKERMESTHGGGTVERIEGDISNINANIADLIQRIDDMERRADGVETNGGSGTTADAPPTPSTPSHTHSDTNERLTKRDGPTDEIRAEVEDEFDALEAGHPSNQSDDSSDEDDDDEDEIPHAKGTTVNERAEYIADRLKMEKGRIYKLDTIEREIDDVWGFSKDETVDTLVDRIAKREGLIAVECTKVKGKGIGNSAYRLATESAIVDGEVHADKHELLTERGERKTGKEAARYVRKDRSLST